MGLTHPEDLVAWQAWQARKRPLRRLKRALRPSGRVPARLIAGGPRVRILVVLESLSPSNRAAFLSPLRHLPLTEVAVLAPGDIVGALPKHDWAIHEQVEDRARDVRVVLAPGHYTELGDRALRLSQSQGVPFVVAQHGLMTPLAPPLPADAHLLAWSEADAKYWWSGRGGRTSMVGSQLLWDACEHVRGPVDPKGAPTYLGQLHGAELPRHTLAQAAGRFCLEHEATYRPHPSEVDRLSLRQHARWVRQGIAVDRSGVPLPELRTPVVGVFSTGILEAAARGIPAWVDFPDPPPWLREFWARYDLRPYGGEPTPAPGRTATEPAAAIAEILRSHL